MVDYSSLEIGHHYDLLTLEMTSDGEMRGYYNCLYKGIKLENGEPNYIFNYKGKMLHVCDDEIYDSKGYYLNNLSHIEKVFEKGGKNE